MGVRVLVLLTPPASRGQAPGGERACDLAGTWTHARPELYTVTHEHGSSAYLVVAAGCSHCAWHNGTLQLAGQQVKAVYDSGDRTHGSLSADCHTITWSDKTSWRKRSAYPPAPAPKPPPPPPPLPPGAIDPASIQEVIVLQSCHLDVGFADFSTNIINRFFHQHFPLALATAHKLKQRQGPGTSRSTAGQRPRDGCCGAQNR